jgi:hypothetical protein
METVAEAISERTKDNSAASAEKRRERPVQKSAILKRLRILQLPPRSLYGNRGAFKRLGLHCLISTSALIDGKSKLVALQPAMNRAVKATTTV